MNNKNLKWVSLAIALVFPFQWLSSRNNPFSIFELSSHPFNDIYFDLSLLAVNFLIVYFILKKVCASYAYRKSLDS